MEDDPHLFSKKTASGVTLSIKVVPKSSTTAIVGVEGGELKIRVAAPPEDGKANKELIRFLSKVFKVPQRDIQLIKGETSRHKVLLIASISIDALKKLF